MAKASDNVFPKLIIAEGTVPANPSAGQQKLYVDSADHKLKRVNSAGTVTTVEGVGGGGGSTYPPGSADIHPVSANAKDDEFDGTSTASWTSTPTAPNAFDINTTRADHAYVKGTGAAPFEGKYQAVPGSYPYTATLKVASSTARGNYHRAGGLILGPAAPVGTSALVYLGSVYDTGNHGAPARGVNRTTETFAGTFASAASFRPFIGHWAALYLRIRVNSATSIDTFASNDGYAWVPIDSAYNPGFTPGVMGFACNDANAGGGVEAYFDWFRVT